MKIGPQHCSICGKVALRVAGKTYFCGDHYEEAVALITKLSKTGKGSTVLQGRFSV